MRADRLLSILLLLQVHRRMTASTLAQRLEVSERTIHRDMEALSSAGIPVRAERGSRGGWTLLEPYRTNLTGLNEAEIQAFFLAIPERLLSDLGLRKASEAGLIKLLAALPSMHRRSVEYVRQRIHIDNASWHSAEEAVPFLSVLQEAIWQEHRLYLTYKRGDATVERLVDPLGLVAKGSQWYFVAAIEGEIRTYRVSRIQNVRVSEDICVRPETFDLAAYWIQSSNSFVANLPRFPVSICIAADVLPQIQQAGRYARIEHIDSPDEHGHLRLCVQFETEDAACGYLLSYGTQVEILEPLELRERVAGLAESVAAFYRQRNKTKTDPGL